MYRFFSLIAALAIFAQPAAAQVVSPLAPAATRSQLDALAAQIPVPATSPPPSETVGGAAGAAMTFRRGDAIQPRLSRTVAFTTSAGGTAVVTWAAMSGPPLVFVVPNIASNATQVTTCFPVDGTATATGVTIKCMTTQTLLGLGLVPFVAAAAGINGQVLALPAS